MLNRLSDLKVRTAKRIGNYADGGGLYLQVRSNNGRISKSWVFRYATGKTTVSDTGRSYQEERQMGLGSIETISLAEAREAALQCRKLRQQGVDPIAARDADKAGKALAAMTFNQCRDAYLAAHRAGWRSVSHSSQWINTLETYVSPVFGSVPVAEIDTELVMRVLEPLWAEKTESASRVRSRIEAILDWATVRGFRQGDNPARWKGHLASLLPSRLKIQKIVHLAAMPYAEVPALVAELRKREALSAKAMEFIILTVARTGEVIGAKWSEIDLVAKVWTVRGDKMKSGRPHRVPLSDAALDILARVPKIDDRVFPLSARAILAQLDRMRSGCTVHGFRSSFRDWCAERTNFPGEVAEAALAHAVGDKVEAAYRRTDLFDRRRRLMNSWSEFCEGTSPVEEVVPLRVS